jgi:hypothetical protein
VVAPAAEGNPATTAVASLADSYFTAINTRDYGEYYGLLDAQLQQHETPAVFASGYRTTTDSAATLTHVGTTDAGIAARLRFTSHQHPSDSPDHSSCDSWHITLFLQPRGIGYMIVEAPAGYHASFHACP